MPHCPTYAPDGQWESLLHTDVESMLLTAASLPGQVTVPSVSAEMWPQLALVWLAFSSRPWGTLLYRGLVH